MTITVRGIVIEDGSDWTSGVEVVVDGRLFFFAHDTSTTHLDWATEGAVNMAGAIRWGIIVGRMAANKHVKNVLDSFSIL